MAKLSVIVAVFNEELRLRSFVEKLISSPCPIEREFIFIDDGSQIDESLTPRSDSEDSECLDTIPG